MTTPAPTQSPPAELTDLDLYTMAEDFLDALLSAADVDTIGRNRWWERAKTALETAAASSDSWRSCAARAARKLQIEAPDERLSTATAKLAKHLDDPDVYARWAELAERDALVITAMVRDRRATRNAKRKTTTEPANPAGKNTKEETQECLPF